KVKEPEPGVIYLPEGLPFSGDDGAAQWILDNWVPKVPPYVIEGHVMARVLRRWAEKNWDPHHCRMPRAPCDCIIACLEPKVEQSPGQAAMTKAVATVWNQISYYFAPITEYL